MPNSDCVSTRNQYAIHNATLGCCAQACKSLSAHTVTCVYCTGQCEQEMEDSRPVSPVPAGSRPSSPFFFLLPGPANWSLAGFRRQPDCEKRWPKFQGTISMPMIRLVTILECCRAMLPAPTVMAVCNEALPIGLLMLVLVTCIKLGCIRHA